MKPAIVDLKRDAKTAVIEVLANGTPASAKQIHKLVVNDRQNPSFTYPAIHKTLRKLEEQGVVVREQALYRLSMSWIIRSKEFLEFAESKQRRPQTVSLSQVKSESSTVIEFNESLTTPFYWLLHELSEYCKKNRVKGETFIVMYGAWPVFVVSQKEYDEISRLTRASKTSLVCTTNYLLDKFVLEFWKRGFGTPFYLGTDPKNRLDQMVFNDFIIQIHNPPEVIEWFNKNLVKKFLDFNALYKMCFQRTFKVKLVIVRNQALADDFRKKLNAQIKKTR